MRRLCSTFLSLVALALASCGTDPSTTCPNDLPSACPSPAPQFAADVQPIFMERCAVCHAPGGESADKPLTKYEEIYPRRQAILTQVYHCLMPRAPSQPLDAAERQKMQGWLVCGAKND